MSNEDRHSSFLIPNSRIRWLKIATGSVDRAGDQLVLAGMDATNFQSNPQFLWQHGSSGALVNTIGKVLDLTVVGNGLYAQVEYATADTNPLAEQIFQLIISCLRGLALQTVFGVERRRADLEQVKEITCERLLSYTKINKRAGSRASGSSE